MTTRATTLFFILLLVLAFIGVADATYLTYEHYSGGQVVCSIVEGCDEVLKSPYASIGPLPLAGVGVLYYLTLLVLSAMVLGGTHRKRAIKAAVLISGIGIIASAFFVYLQASVIGAYCLYCLVSALITTLFFVIALVLYKKKYKTDPKNPNLSE